MRQRRLCSTLRVIGCETNQVVCATNRGLLYSGLRLANEYTRFFRNHRLVEEKALIRRALLLAVAVPDHAAQTHDDENRSRVSRSQSLGVRHEWNYNLV